MVSEIPRLFFRYCIDYIMGREDGLHFSASQVSGSSRSYHVFKIFCWYQELLKLVFVYIKMIPEVQGRAFACVVSPGCSFVLYLLDFVGCSTAPAPVELQDWSVSATNWWSDFAVVISKCCELLVLCRKKAPSCYTSDWILWRSVKTELGSGVSLSLWDLLMGGWMLEGTPGALKLCWVEGHILFFTCFTAFPGGFGFFFPFALFCRQFHFVLIKALPDATLNSVLLSPVHSTYSTVVWFPCLASGRICFFNYKVNFFLWTQFKQLTVMLIYPLMPMTGFPCKQKLHLSSGTNFYEYISWNVGYFYKVCKWKWKILRGCPGMWRAYISVWTWVSKPVLAFKNGCFIWFRVSVLADW